MVRAPSTLLGRMIVVSALGVALALGGCSGDTTNGESSVASETASTASSNSTPSENVASSPSSTSTQSPGNAAPDPDGSADLATATFYLEWNDAVEIAMDRFDGQLTKVGLDWERDQWAYAVELVSDSEEYDIKINAMDGTVLREETDRLDGDDVVESRNDIFDPATVVHLQAATEAALNEVDGRITEWKLEGSSRGTFFEFEILPNDGRGDVDVRVDAITGDVVEVD